MRMRSSARSTSFLSRMKLTSPSRSNGDTASMIRSAAPPTGSTILASLTIRSWRLPGSAQRRRAARVRMAASDMGENVLFGPAGKVEHRSRRKEVEAGLRKLDPLLALQPDVELLLQPVQIAHVAGGIFALRIADLARPPVAGLLLLRQVLAEHFLDQFL